MAYRILKIEKGRNWRASTQKASLIGKTPNWNYRFESCAFFFRENYTSFNENNEHFKGG